MAIFTDEQNEEILELQCAARNLAERLVAMGRQHDTTAEARTILLDRSNAAHGLANALAFDEGR